MKRIDMSGSKIFLGTRKTNGQIASLSDSVDLSGFIELIKEIGERRVLVDYSPVIEKLHEMHKSINDENLRNEYNSMFNYWVDAKTHQLESIRFHKSEVLAGQANGLINKITLRLQQSTTNGELTYRYVTNNSFGGISKVDAFRSDVEMYIEALLIFIHSKASLEIGSFKRDVLLTRYGKSLEDLLRGMYLTILRQGNIGQDSFLKFLAFERRAELPQYLALNGDGETSDSFMLRVLKAEKPYEDNHATWGACQKISIEYDRTWPNFMPIIEVLKVLIYKISLINEFLAALRAGNIEWDDGGSSVAELQERLLLLE